MTRLARNLTSNDEFPLCMIEIVEQSAVKNLENTAESFPYLFSFMHSRFDKRFSIKLQEHLIPKTEFTTVNDKIARRPIIQGQKIA